MNENLNELTNAALSGDRETNKLLSETIIQNDKLIFLNIINHRLNRLLDLINLGIKSNIDQALNSIKLNFLKDKSNFIEQSKKLTK